MIIHDKKLYEQVKKDADKKFEARSGIYRSAWIIREYKKRGGRISGKKNTKGGLTRWFDEKWVDINRPIKNSTGKVVGYAQCGRKNTSSGKYPLCRPSKRITKDTPKTIDELSKKSIKKAQIDKSKVKGDGNIMFGGFYGAPAIKKTLVRNIHLKYKSPKTRPIQETKRVGRFTVIKYQSGGGRASREYCQKTSCDKMGFSQKASCRKYKNCYNTTQFFGKQSDVMIRVPSAVKAEAELAFKLKKIGFKGGKETGWKRAHQLVNDKRISIQDVKYMRNWYARHYYTSRPNYLKWKEARMPLDKEWFNVRAIQSYLIWGGESGLKWVNSKKVIEMLNKYFNKEYKVIGK